MPLLKLLFVVCSFYKIDEDLEVTPARFSCHTRLAAITGLTRDTSSASGFKLAPV